MGKGSPYQILVRMIKPHNTKQSGIGGQKIKKIQLCMEIWQHLKWMKVQTSEVVVLGYLDGYLTKDIIGSISQALNRINYK